MLLLNIDYIPETEFEVLGLVDGSVVCALEPYKQFVAHLTESWVGGEVTEYSKLMVQARQTAIERMMDNAELLHADAVINIRYTTSEISQGAAEVLAYGTAVRYA